VGKAMGAVDTVAAVDVVEQVEAEIATRVSTPIAKLTAMLQMHTERGNVLRMKETMISRFVSSAGCQAT